MLVSTWFLKIKTFPASGVYITYPHEMILPGFKLQLQCNYIIALFPVALWGLSGIHVSGS